jgi:adenylate kinase family enzyme
VRADDTPEVFLHRLDDYGRQIPGIRAHYSDRLVKVDSSGDEDEVYARMLDALGLTPVPA